MDSVVTLLGDAHKFGLRVWIEGGNLQVEGHPTPEAEATVEALGRHRGQVLAYILEHPRAESLNYYVRFHGSGPQQAELAEIQGRVEEEGYVLLWSTVLEDFIAFHKTEADKAQIPPGFVPYSTKELTELFGEENTSPSKHHLKLIHEAKKQGARIIEHDDGGDEAHHEL